MLEGRQSLLDRLGKRRGPLNDILKFSVAMSEVRQHINGGGSDSDDIQLHPVAKAALACINVVYDVRFFLLIQQNQAEVNDA